MDSGQKSQEDKDLISVLTWGTQKGLFVQILLGLWV
jgi:hypothetical protein